MIQRETLSISIYDPGQDAKIPLLKVPADHTYTIESASISVDRATAASETDYWDVKLQNGGTDQAGTTDISDVLVGAAGIEANTADAFAITDGAGDLTAGQWLMLVYNETLAGGDVSPGLISVTIEYVDGVGSTA